MIAQLKNLILKILRQILAQVGGVLLSTKVYGGLLSQRALAVHQLTQINSLNLEPGLTGLIFSKDRALQLYSLLFTYFKLVKNPAPLFVIYNASTGDHEKSYLEIAQALNEISIPVILVKEQKSFRETLLQVLDRIKTKNIFCLVDDIIFIRSVDLALAAKINPLESILSLRHSPHLRRSYTANAEQAPPNFRPSTRHPILLEFNWFEKGHEWSDPWSVDGQILATAELKSLSQICQFKAPNTYEGELKSFNDLCRNRLGLCYSESKILNLPINRIQNEVLNRSGNISPEVLLQHWNLGEMLNTQQFNQHIPQSPHEEHLINFCSRQKIELSI